MIHSKKVLKNLEDVLAHWKELIIKDEFPVNAILSIIDSDLRQFIRKRKHAYKKENKK